MRTTATTTLLFSLLGSLTSAKQSSSYQQQQQLPQTSVTVLIPATQQLPNPNLLPASTSATLSALNKPYLSAPISVGSTFVFHNVTPGSYLVDVHCTAYAFAPLRLDVLRSAAAAEEEDVGGGRGERDPGAALIVKAWETYRGNDWGNKGEEVTRKGEKNVVEVRVLGYKGYFLERSTFSVLSIFKNPIILLSLVSMGLFLGMPKLVENMDPEMRAEWEENQKKNPMNALMGAASGQQAANPVANFDMAAYLAGSSKKEDGNGGKKKR